MTRQTMRKRSLMTAVILLAAAVPCLAITSTTINIDGDMGDWTRVLVDPENAIADAGGFAGDPDNPGADRDLRGFAYTWDDTHLYFWWRRTLSGTNTITFSVYMDLDFDGLMSSTDVVARWRFSGGEFKSSEMVAYDDGGSPDLITGDGVPMPGGFGAGLPAVQDGAGSLSGILLEGSIDWASLGVAPGSPLNFHVSAGTNNNSEDNMRAFDSLYSRIEFQSDQAVSVLPGEEVWIPHTLGNDGNGIDIIDLLVEATQAWDHALYTDPDGDGDPSDGTLIAVDSNGDGDYDDPFDVPPAPSHDGDNNGIADSGLLAPGATFAFVLGVRAPATAPNGALDEVTLVARSGNVTSVRKLVEDTVTAGLLTLQPDRTGRVRPGESVDYPVNACNGGSQPELLNFTGNSLQGWPHTFFSDPDGDGDPSDGQALTDTDGDTAVDLLLEPGACASFVVRADVPAGANLGDQDSLQLLGVADPSGLQAEVFLVTTAGDGVSLTPVRSADVSVGGTVFYRHTLVNGLGFDEIYDLQATSTLGSALSIYADPDQDGIPEDSVPITETPVLEANGGEFHMVVQAQTPIGVTHASVDDIQITATSRTDPGVQAAVTDQTSVQNLLTFSDPLFARPATSFFGACSDIFAEGSGLATNLDFRFVWNDPDPLDGAEQTTGIRKPDADGLVDDIYVLGGADLTGQWQVRLQVRSGSNWDNLTIGGARNFTVLDSGGEIQSLEPGKLGFFIQGESLAVTSVLENPTPVDFRDTSLRYVVFQDQNGDGLPTDGEPYILQDGSSAGYAVGGFTHRTPRVELDRGQVFRDFWRVTNVTFPVSGTWTIYLAWELRCGTAMDEWTSGISVCAVLPQADAGASGPVCRGVATPIGSSAQPGYSYRWFPEDDLDDPQRADPQVTLEQDRLYTLVVVEDATGCSNTDIVDLQVVENPVADITPDAPVINVGGTVTLDAGPSGMNYHWTTQPSGEPGDGATTQTIDVSPSQDTLYTVTVTDGVGCQGMAQETVTVNPNPPEPVIQLSADALCLGDALTLDAGVAGAEYLWSTNPAGEPGDGSVTRSLQVTPTQDTTYTVLVTDGVGQQGSDSAAVTVLTTTPDSVGSTLRVSKDTAAGDVLLSWQPVPDAWTYNVYRADRADYGGRQLQANESGESHRNPGALDGNRLYLYQVHGQACFEGPR